MWHVVVHVGEQKQVCGWQMGWLVLSGGPMAFIFSGSLWWGIVFCAGSFGSWIFFWLGVAKSRDPYSMWTSV